jgi:hypothetical protein
MGPSPGKGFSGQFDNARFDDHAPLPQRGICVPRRQDTSDTGASPDPAAVKPGFAIYCRPARPSSREIGSRQYAVQKLG